MSAIPLLPIRERIRDLNTKAYYLLVALSFIYRMNSQAYSIKIAFTLTAVSAVLPVQDWVKSTFWLEVFRIAKVIGLTVALVCAIYWTWAVPATAN